MRDDTPLVDGLPPVLVLADLARLLRMSQRTIRARRADGTFPFPTLSSLDRTPRWSRDQVLEILRCGGALTRVRPRRIA